MYPIQYRIYIYIYIYTRRSSVLVSTGSPIGVPDTSCGDILRVGVPGALPALVSSVYIYIYIYSVYVYTYYRPATSLWGISPL